MKYTVDPQALDAAADRVKRALDLIATIRIDEDLKPLTYAFAGGVTVGGLKSTTNLWDIQLAGARGQLRFLGSALLEAAEGYGGLESLTVPRPRGAGPETP